MEELEREWREIAPLIAADKKAALEEFHRRPLVLVEPAPAAPLLIRLRPALPAVAASLLLAAGLAALWLLRGNWQSGPLATAGSEFLAGSFLYAAAGEAEPAVSGSAVTAPVSPCFSAWAAAALQGSAAAGAARERTTGSGAIVERGDPEKVRRAIGRAIREGAFERMLSQLQEFHDQEV